MRLNHPNRLDSQPGSRGNRPVALRIRSGLERVSQARVLLRLLLIPNHLRSNALTTTRPCSAFVQALLQSWTATYARLEFADPTTRSNPRIQEVARFPAQPLG